VSLFLSLSQIPSRESKNTTQSLAVYSAPDTGSGSTHRVVSASFSGLGLDVSDAITGTKLQVLQFPHNRRGLTTYVSPDGLPRIVCGDDEGHLSIWDGSGDYALLRNFWAHSGFIRLPHVYYEPVGGRPRVASGGEDSLVRVFDPETGELISSIGGLRASIRIIDSHASADGQRQLLAAGDEEGNLFLCDPESGAVIQHIAVHTKHIRSLAFFQPTSAPDRVYFVSASEDNTAKVWDDAGVMVGDLSDPDKPAEVWSVATYKERVGEEDRIVTGDSRGSLRVWTETGALLRVFPRDDDRGRECRHAMAVFRASDGACRLVSNNRRSGIDIWDPETGELLTTVEVGVSYIVRLRCFESDDGRNLAASIEYTGQVRVWQLGDAQPSTTAVRAANKLG
jgi:WD40 repeat protein